MTNKYLNAIAVLCLVIQQAFCSNILAAEHASWLVQTISCWSMATSDRMRGTVPSASASSSN